MKKRMLSAILAMSMVMGMSSVTAFAADDTATYDNLADASANEFSAENEKVTIPKVNVTVPTSGEIVLDPFNISQKGQITSADFKVINNSQVPLTVTIKNAKAVGTDGVNIVPKVTKDGTKWAMVNMNVIDGLGKTTTKALTNPGEEEDGTPKPGQDIVVATAMAPKGGIVKYNFSGSSADIITATDEDGNVLDWDSDADKITVSNTFAFTMNSYAVYEIKKTMVSSVTAVNYDLYTDFEMVDDDSNPDTEEVKKSTIPADEDAIVATFPATVLGDGKEVPVTWEYVAASEDDEYDGTAVGTYTFKAVVADADIYKVAENVTMPTITVTIADTTPTP